MKQSKNSWQKSVSTPSITKTITFSTSEAAELKKSDEKGKIKIVPVERYTRRRYSFDDNGGGYTGL
ncbi:MAG: hypothetical protein ACM3VS_14820 [Candidatus Dadabacteria bacterium]